MLEKQDHLVNPATIQAASRAPSRKLSRPFRILAAAASVFVVLVIYQAYGSTRFNCTLVDEDDGDYAHLCPQSDALLPSKHTDIWNQLVNNKFTTDEFKKKAIELLSGAVQIRCVKCAISCPRVYRFAEQNLMM